MTNIKFNIFMHYSVCHQCVKYNFHLFTVKIKTSIHHVLLLFHREQDRKYFQEKILIFLVIYILKRMFCCLGARVQISSFYFMQESMSFSQCLTNTNYSFRACLSIICKSPDSICKNPKKKKMGVSLNAFPYIQKFTTIFLTQIYLLQIHSNYKLLHASHET